MQQPNPGLEGLQLVVVTGKGGVGKSLLTAVLGRRLEETGRQVLLMELDPRESLHALLDVEPSGGSPVRVGARLYLQNVQPRSIADELVVERLKIGLLSRRVLASPVYQHFVEGAPGLKETAVLGRVLRVLAGRDLHGMPRPDVVLLDAPATGHGVSLLTAPGLVSDVVRGGPVGNLAEEIAGFVADPDRTGVVVVTTAEEMPVQEARELLDLVESRLGHAPEVVIVNALYPPLPPAVSRSRSTDPATTLWRRRRRVNERELARLARRWTGPTALLPLLPLDRGPELVEALEVELERALHFASAQTP